MTARRCSETRRGCGSWIAAGLVLALCAGASAAEAQYIRFGKNKVNYREFDWAALRSEHFDLYYYPEEEELALIAIGMAEESYRVHRERFVHEVEDRIPIILYSSQHDFEQTNITPMIIPEGVAGLTESMRGRVLMPFDGSLSDFSRTLEHELVHAFQLSMAERLHRDRGQTRSAGMPLWFTEGLAEHWSGNRSPDGDMILRDLVISGNLPSIAGIPEYDGTFALYKIGQSLVQFIAETYGEDKLALFYTEKWKARRFEDLLAEVLGADLEEVDARWTQWLRRRYYPDVLEVEPLLPTAQRVSIWGMELKPTPIPDSLEGVSGDFVFISPHSGYVNIYSGTLEEGGGEPRVLIEGERKPEYLSFHAYRSRMDISATGWLVFSSHCGRRDELSAYDLKSGEIVGRWGFDDLVGITSPQWDLRGRAVVFSGLSRTGYRDLYRLDIETGERERLTEDRFCDLEPAIHPDGRWIAFVSDRAPQGREGARNLFLLDLETRYIRPLTQGPWWDASPCWSPDGTQLLFTSSRENRRDLYTVDLQGRGARRTHAQETILDPRWLPSGREVLATLYANGRLETAVIPLSPPAPADSFRQEPERVATAPWWLTAPVATEVQRGEYRSRFSIDVAQGGVAVDPGLGSGQGLQMLLRDLMGDRLIFIQMGNTTIATQDFLDNLSAGVTYVDLSRRLNRGISLYHHAGTYYDEQRRPFFERRVGASGLLSYPLSRFTRLETSFGLAYSDKEHPSTGFERRGMLATHYLSWIHDTALWLPTGPIDGDRMHLTAGLTLNLNRPGLENYLLLADARRYFRLGQRSALAARLQGRFSGGEDPQAFQLGGSSSLRGYPYRELYGTRSLLANVELRIPLLNRFLVDSALGGVLAFPGIQGAVFFDAGQAWYDAWPDAWQGSYGLGLRMGLAGMLVLRWDIARRTDFESWDDRSRTEFSIGWDY
ncbi:MAG: BamA/TamA family outer membrane protein [Candidatus Eisenbacteria bacterium]